MKMESFEDLRSELLDSKDVRVAGVENRLRRELASHFEAARVEHKLSVRELAVAMETSTSQVQRLLHHEAGGSLTLSTLCRAADALDVELVVTVRGRHNQSVQLVPFECGGWTKTQAEQVEEHRTLPPPQAAGERPSKTWNSSPVSGDALPACRAVGD